MEKLKPNPKEKWTFVEIAVESNNHRMERCAAAGVISLHEMRKKQ